MQHNAVETIQNAGNKKIFYLGVEREKKSKK